MKTNRLYLTITLVGTVLAGCQKMEEPAPQELARDNGSWILSLEASKELPATKALELDSEGATLNAYWKDGETVAVYFNEKLLGTLEAKATGDKSATATLSGKLDKVDGLSVNSALTLLFPRSTWDYTGQTGAAPSATGSLATNYDYATASVTVKTLDTYAKAITTTSASFTNEQSIYRFGFLVDGAGSAISVKEFSVGASDDRLVQSRTYASGAWTSTYGPISVHQPSSPDGNLYYLAIRNENTYTSQAEPYSFLLVDGNDALYSGDKNIPGGKLGNGNFISAKTVSVSQVQLTPKGNHTILEFEVL